MSASAFDARYYAAAYYSGCRYYAFAMPIIAAIDLLRRRRCFADAARLPLFALFRFRFFADAADADCRFH